MYKVVAFLQKKFILQKMAKSYFLLKSEPNVWSLDQQIKSGSRGSMWDGVRNYQASNNLKKKFILYIMGQKWLLKPTLVIHR